MSLTNIFSQISIRQARFSDIDGLVPLLKMLFSIEKDFDFNEKKQRMGLAMMLEAPANRCIIVAERDKKIIGLCSAQLVISTAEGGLSALIEDMAVEKAYQYQGIGGKLLAAIEKWSWEQGATRLQLLADRINMPALQFYQKMNWQSTQLICLRKTDIDKAGFSLES